MKHLPVCFLAILAVAASPGSATAIAKQVKTTPVTDENYSLAETDGIMAGKPVGIDLHIGRKPIFAAGNVRSGGDISMLTYCHSNQLPSLQVLVNHDDADREFAYSEKDNASLKAAREQGWQVVSMKSDWKHIFSFREE